MKKHILATAALAGITLTVSACSPAAYESAEAVQTEQANIATGWEMNPEGSAERIKAAGLSVLKGEGQAEHFHAHLDVFVDGKAIVVPADIGLTTGPDGQHDGISALHTHDDSGIIHVEAPHAGDTYLLGQLLTQWGVLDGTDPTPGSAHSGIHDWSVAVNGKKQDMPVSSVVLKAHDEVVLYHGTAPTPLPSSYTFPDGL